MKCLLEPLSRFFWSDMYHIEGSTAYFLPGTYNALFSLNLLTNYCKFLDKIPSENNFGFRMNSRCVKINNLVLCMPDRSNSMWVYCLDSKTFREIKIDNPDNVRLDFCKYYIYRDKLFIFSRGTQCIHEFDIRKQEFVRQYPFTLQKNEHIMNVLFIEGIIWGVSNITGRIFSVNLDDMQRTEHELPGVSLKLRTICFDGTSFWLSGNKREIYRWRKSDSKLWIMSDFPRDFGFYSSNKRNNVDIDSTEYTSQTFIESCYVNRKVWFIPYQTNQILTVNTQNNVIETYIMPEEEETSMEIYKRGMQHKYILEYVRSNRYIGLFSLKNDCLLEIDTMNNNTVYKKISFDVNSVCSNGILRREKGFKLMFDENNFYNDVFCADMAWCIFNGASDVNVSKLQNLSDTIGERLYDIMIA